MFFRHLIAPNLKRTHTYYELQIKCMVSYIMVFFSKTLCFHQVLNASREGVTMQWTIYAHPLGPLGLTKSFSLLKLFLETTRSNTVWSKGLSGTSFHTPGQLREDLKKTILLCLLASYRTEWGWRSQLNR